MNNGEINNHRIPVRISEVDDREINTFTIPITVSLVISYEKVVNWASLYGWKPYCHYNFIKDDEYAGYHSGPIYHAILDICTKENLDIFEALETIKGKKFKAEFV